MGEKPPDVDTLLFSLSSNSIQKSKYSRAIGLATMTAGMRNAPGVFSLDSRELSGQNFGQVGGRPGAVDVEPFDDVDTVFADLDADRPPERSSRARRGRSPAGQPG